MVNKDISKLLYVRFCTIYGKKFVQDYHNESFLQIWYEDWADGLIGIENDTIRKALEYCKKNLEWAPSLPEFIKICDNFSGLPSCEEALDIMVEFNHNREYNVHPVIKLSFSKMSTYDIRHDKRKTLLKKFKPVYEEALLSWKENRISCLKKLEAPTSNDNVTIGFMD